MARVGFEPTVSSS